MQSFVVAYDVFDTKRLPKIQKIVYSYALGGQKSSLEVLLDKASMQELIARIDAVAKPEDKINIIKVVEDPILLGKAVYTKQQNEGIIIL